MSLSFIMSVQHTGSWFLIRLVEKSPDIAKVLMAIHVRPTVFTTCYKQKSKHCAHDHFNYPHAATDCVRQLLLTCPVVMPVRDPLLALITKQSREPAHDHSYVIADCQAMLAAHTRYNAYLVPIDVTLSAPRREELLRGMFTHLGLRPPGMLRRCAVHWPAQNRSVDVSQVIKRRRLKYGHYYVTRDYEKLHEVLGKSAVALDNAKDVLQPFYTALGYKDLLWFA